MEAFSTKSVESCFPYNLWKINFHCIVNELMEAFSTKSMEFSCPKNLWKTTVKYVLLLVNEFTLNHFYGKISHNLQQQWKEGESDVGNDSNYQCLRLPNFWVGEEVTILIWKRENWRGGGNFQTIAAHTILKVIGPRFFQRRKRSRRGRWSSRRRSYCTPNTKVSQRMCFRHAITEFKTLL